MGRQVSKLTVLLPTELLNGARRAAQVRETTLTAIVVSGLEKFVAHVADDQGKSVEVFCRRHVQLKAGRPRRG